jgi:hypothetical protein
MTFINWLMGLISQLVEWHTRRRNLGISLLSITSLVFIAVATGGLSVEAAGVAGLVKAFKFSTGEGLPGQLLSLLVYVLLVGWIMGLVLVFDSYMRERRQEDINRVIVVEMRGLVDTSDHPLISAVPPALVGQRFDALVDARALLANTPPNVAEAMRELDDVRRTVRRARGDTARAHVKVVAGGVMHVPLLFYAGTLFDDEGKVVLMDWERTAGKWLELNQADDGGRFAVTGLDTLLTTADVVVAVSASYAASLYDIAATFPGLPVVHLARANPSPNTLWSEDAQAALTQQYLHAMATLAGKGVETVHLVLAAPATLSIRFGMAYDHRNMPNLRCYHRERDHVPSYPWSIQMGTATQAARYVTTSFAAVVDIQPEGTL